MPLVRVVVVRVAILGVVGQRNIIHAANGASARLIAAAAFAMHGAHIGGGIFRPLISRMLGLTCGFLLAIGLLVLVAAAARGQGKGAKRQANHGGYKDFFHNYQV